MQLHHSNEWNSEMAGMGHKKGARESLWPNDHFQFALEISGDKQVYLRFQTRTNGLFLKGGEIVKNVFTFLRAMNLTTSNSTSTQSGKKKTLKAYILWNLLPKFASNDPFPGTLTYCSEKRQFSLFHCAWIRVHLVVGGDTYTFVSPCLGHDGWAHALGNMGFLTVPVHS